METKIVLSLVEDKVNVSFEPTLDKDSFIQHVNVALNSMPSALLNMFATVPLLRPACDRERDAHIYVFAEGEHGEVENNLYKYRKHLYDTTAAVFSNLLATAFPDIEYIEGCKQYQQEFCMAHNADEVKEFIENTADVTAYVREHMEEIIKEVMSDETEPEE